MTPQQPSDPNALVLVSIYVGANNQVHELSNKIATRFGGATLFFADGFWVDDDRALRGEASRVLQVCVRRAFYDPDMRELRNTVRVWLRDTGETSALIVGKDAGAIFVRYDEADELPPYVKPDHGFDTEERFAITDIPRVG